MKNFKTGGSLRSPQTGATIACITNRTTAKTFLNGTLLLLSFLLLTTQVRAVSIPTTSLSCTQLTTPTTTCVTGYFASGWTSGTGAWTYTLTTSGYSGISMTFNTSSSATGPKKGYVYYNAGAGDVFVDSFTVTTSCVSRTINFPAGCDNVPSLSVKFNMAGATNAGGTNRVPSDGGFNGTSSACVGAPTGGTAAADITSICGSGTSNLTLSGASGGAGITYQWQSSSDNATWNNISGETNTVYTTPVITASTYYRVVTTCTASSLSAASSSAAVTVNPLPAVSPIVGVSAAPLLVGASVALSDATAGGTWSSSNLAVASVDASGNVTSIKGGTTTIRYEVTDVMTGCINAATAVVNVVWPNTLALYAGEGGNSTNVIAIPGETTGTLTATNFGSASLCSSGGLSGLTVRTVNNAYNSDSAHVSYIITPDAGQALNVFRIHAVTRESVTGPTQARIAYRINGGAWIDEGTDVAQHTGGSCGSGSNSWDFTPGLTLTGITTNIEVGVFPYAPGANTGTFQLNSLEVYGVVTSSDPCSGTPAPGIVTPAAVYLCDSGSRFLTFTGDAGVGISYQWQSSTDNISFSNIAGATNASYNTGMLHAGVDPAVTYYRVVTTCSSSGLSNNSLADTVNLNPSPDAGIITAPVYIHIGDPVTLTSTVSGGMWSSNDTSTVSISASSGLATAHIPGDAVITYSITANGCTGRSKDTVKSIWPNTVAAYIGNGGNSTAVDVSAAVTASPLTENFGSTTPCSNGGISGLTNNGVATYSASGAHASFVMTAAAAFDVIGFHATVRRTALGMQNVRLAYNLNGTGWVTDGVDQLVDQDDCGYSTTDLSFGAALPSGLVTGDNVEFAVFGYNPGTSNGTLQINAIDIVGRGAVALRKAPTALVSESADVKLFPNPATSTLNVTASEPVNVTVLSIDGKQLIDQKDAKSINVNGLANGLYIIRVYNAGNALIKTERFTKQ